MSVLSPDASTYRGPPRREAHGPTFPLWMFHPILPAQIVSSLAQQTTLIDSDPRWSSIPSSTNPLSTLSHSLYAQEDDFPLLPGQTRLLLLPPFGGCVMTGLDASNVTDDAQVLLYNTSNVDTISFLNLSDESMPGNQFSCPQGSTGVLQPLTATRLRYVINQWVFS